jgi:nitroimidazol reductase NimA-like FMN-containing flavoprotein (pyridoxamine 5'-phosphate oxidase superfamily)
MRRQDKTIDDPDELHRILDDAFVVHLGLVDNGRPYVVPLNFGREGDVLYVHCASEGRKLRCLAAQSAVCVEVEKLIRVTKGETACGAWTSHYESVIGFGTARIVESNDERERGLQAIMAKYSGRRDWSFKPETLAKTVVVRVDLETISGKRSPAPV